jgi:hypothetical protein
MNDIFWYFITTNREDENLIENKYNFKNLQFPMPTILSKITRSLPLISLPLVNIYYSLAL